MTNSYYKINLDVQDHGSIVSLRAKRGDTGRLLYINLTDGGNPYRLTSDCYAVFTAKKPDGKIVFNDCSIIGNSICYAFTPQTTMVPGKVECEIKLYGSDDKMLTSAAFSIIVEDTIYNEGDALESTQEVSALTKLLSDITDLITTVTSKLTSGAFKGAKGDKGETGDRGPQGVSYVATNIPTGYFALEMDSATGDLYCVTEEGVAGPTFGIDEDGNFYHDIKED